MYAESRLDAVSSVFFQRQLEHIEAQVYQTKYPSLMAMQLIPIVGGIPEWAKVYTWRMMDETGSYKVISNMADDLPRADVSGVENSKVIKTLGSAFGYDMDEITVAAQTPGASLDVARANSARRQIETGLDDLLSAGDTTHGIEGFIAPTDAQSYTLADKTAGGKTWGTVGALNATGREIAADLMGIAAARVEATKGLFTRFTIVLPIAQYLAASSTPFGPEGTVSALEYALKNSPHIESVVPWYRLTGAAAGPLNVMLCYARDPEVVAGIVPRRFTMHERQQRNLSYVVPCTAKCGGIVLRYGAAFARATGL
jgi:hypothetical protein